MVDAGVLQRILEATSTDDVVRGVGEATRQLGFDTYTILQVQDRPDGPKFRHWDNAPVEFSSMHDLGLAAIDPVMQHAKHNSLPLCWGREDYARIGLDHVWREQAEFGFRSGIITALHMPNGRHLAIGIDVNSDRPGNATEVTMVSAYLQLLTTHVQCAFDRLGANNFATTISLAPREIECLRWALQGKTAWETSKILGIAERTAVQYLTRAAKELGAANKNMAVIKALQLGLL